MRIRFLILLFIPILCQGQYEVKPDVKPMFRSLYEAQTPITPAADTSNFYVNIDSVGDGSSDLNDGNTPATAWATITKVNGETFDPGDQILFNRGDTWTSDPLTIPSDSMSLAAYGTGDDPIFNGRDSIDGWDTPGNWTDAGGGVWYLTGVAAGNGRMRVWTDDEERRRSETINVDTLNFWYRSNDTMWVSSTINPADQYTTFENTGQFFASIFMVDKTGITIRNIDTRGYQNGIYANGWSNVLIEDCDNIGLDVSWSGVQSFSTGAHPLCDNITIRNNNFDTGDTLFYDYNATPTEDAIHIRNRHSNVDVDGNTFKNWHHGAWVPWQTVAGDTSLNLKFHDNDVSAEDIDYGRAFTIAIAGTDTNHAIYNNNFHDLTLRSQLVGSYHKIYQNIFNNIAGVNHTPALGQGLSFDLAVGEDYYIIGNWLVNNIFLNCNGYGIMIPGYVVDTVYDNMIANNIIMTNDVTTNYGIYMSDRPTVGANTWQFNNIWKSGVTDVIYYGHDGGDDYPKTVTEFNAEDGTADDSIAANIGGESLFYGATNFHLITNTPGAGDGTPISWLTTDYEGRPWSEPWSMGIYDSIYPDEIAPIALSAETIDTNVIAIHFNEYLHPDSTAPSNTMGVTYGIQTPTVDSTRNSGDTTLVYMATAPDADTAILISYTQGFPALQDTFNNVVLTWVDTIVTNNVVADCGGGSDNYGDVGGSTGTGTLQDDFVYYMPVTVVTCGTVSSVTAYIGNVASTGTIIGIYTDDAGEPGTLLSNGATDVLVETADQNNVWTFTIDPSVDSATDYWIGTLADDDHNLGSGGGAVDVWFEAQAYGSGLPATANAADLGIDWDWGLYITVAH